MRFRNFCHTRKSLEPPNILICNIHESYVFQKTPVVRSQQVACFSPIFCFLKQSGNDLCTYMYMQVFESYVKRTTVWFGKHSLDDYIFRQARKFILTKNHWRYHWRKLITIFRNFVSSRKIVLQVSYFKKINTTDQLTSPVFLVCFWPRLIWLLKAYNGGILGFSKVWKNTNN